MNKTIKTIAILALVLGSTKAISQNAAINSTGSAPDASAMLDVSSTTKGLLAPRMTSAQRAAIASPATGLLVYQTDGTDGFYYYDSAGWVMLITSNASDLTSGTVGTARLGTGTADNTTFLRGDGTWANTSDYTLISSTQTLGNYSGKYLITANNVVYTLPATPATGTVLFFTTTKFGVTVNTNGNPIIYFDGSSLATLGTGVYGTGESGLGAGDSYLGYSYKLVFDGTGWYFNNEN